MQLSVFHCSRLQEMVNDVTTLCIRVMRLQGAQVEQLMTADYDMCALLPVAAGPSPIG